MCGRTGLSLNKDQVQCACSYKPRDSSSYAKPDWLQEHNNGKEYTPSYNIAPTEVTPVLVSGSKYKNATQSERVLKPMMWGMIPPWHKGEYNTHNLSTNNCRIENLKNSKLYNTAIQSGGRCVVICEGFYEWQTTNKLGNTKQPHYIYSPQESGIKIDESDTWKNSFDEEKGWSGVKLLYMAGLYNVWKKDDTVIYSYSIITMDSNETLNWLHHRMPAILDNHEQIQAWLDIVNVNPEMALTYLTPVKMLSWHQVASTVNNSRNKTMDCNKRISKKDSKQTTLTSWFNRAEKRKSAEESSNSDKKKKCCLPMK